MVIEQVISCLVLVQHYFLSVCRYAALYVKRLGSLTFPEIDGGATGVCTKDAWNLDSSDKKQSHHHSAKRKIKQLKTIHEIPGPRCFPVFGSLFEFNKFGSRRVHELSKARHEKYGEIFRERLLSQELVFMTNTDLMKQWMSQEGKLPSSLKQEPSYLFGEVYPDLKRGLFFRDGEEWLKMRRLGHFIIHKNASDFDLHGLFDGCQEFMEGFMSKLKTKQCNGGKIGVIDDVEIMGYEVAVGALITVVYGNSVENFEAYTGTDINTLYTNAKALNECHQNLLDMPARLAKLFNTATWRGYHERLEHNLRACITFGQKLREDIKRNPEACSMRTHGLLYKTIPTDAETRDVDDLLSDLAVDTKDPFAGTTMFVTLVLAHYPQVQEKILEEVNKIYPDNEPITYGKLRQMEYTEAFFKEVLRLYPVATFTARVALEDTVIGEYHIPPGTMLMFSTWVAQRDPKYFSEPDKLIPERWLKQTADQYRCDSRAFGAFGLGQRICLGMFFAISINVMYIAHFVRNFKLTCASLPEVEMKTVLYPKNPEPIHLEIRQ